MASAADGLACLPTDVVRLITDRLPPRCLRDLRASARSVGRLPSSELVTSLCVPLDAQHLSRQPSQAARLAQMWRLKRLEIAAGSLFTGLFCSSDQNFRGQGITNTRFANAWCQAEQHAHIQLVLLLSPRVMPWIGAGLRTLVLTGLPISCVLIAAACLRSASHAGCLTLTDLHLAGIRIYSVDGSSDQATQGQGTWPALFAALASVSSLQSLEMCDRLGLNDGLGKMHQLRSLRLVSGNPWQEIAHLSALTQLHVASVDVAPSMLPMGLRSLDILSHRWGPAAPDKALQAAAELTLLTSLRIHTCHGMLPGSGSMTQLVSLQLPYARVAVAQVAALQLLTHLECYQLQVPAASSSDCLPALCHLHCAFLGPAEGAGALCKAVCLTVPRLQSLTLDEVLNDCGVGFAASEAVGLWPAGAAHRMCHLTHLSFMTHSDALANFLLPIAYACNALQSLQVKFAQGAKLSGASLPPLLFGKQDPAVQLLSKLLTRLELAGHLHDALLLDIMASRVPNLRVLVLDSFGKGTLTDVGIVALSLACPLRDLSLDRCAGLTVSGLMAAATNPRLERVVVTRCHQVSDADARDVMLRAGRPSLYISVSHGQ